MLEVILENSISYIKNPDELTNNDLTEDLSYVNKAEDYNYTKGIRTLAFLKQRIEAGHPNLEGRFKQTQFLVNQANKKRKVKLYDNGKFPTGLLYLVEEYLQKFNIEYKLIDKRKKPKLLKHKFVTKTSFPPLRYYQQEAVKKALEKERGVLSLATGAGKTLTLSKIIWELGVNTLIITPNKEINNMMFDTMVKYFGKGKVKKLTSKSKADRPINIGNIQALIRLDKGALKDIDCVIIDEFHHCLRGDTKIKTDKGVLSIKQIVENKVDCKVVSYNETSGKFEYKQVITGFRYNAPDELIELEYESPTGVKKLICTSNHKIYTTNRGYVLAQDLNIEDDVIINKGYVCRHCGIHYNNLNALGGCAGGHVTPIEVKQKQAIHMTNHPNHNNPEARKKNSESKKGDKNPSKRADVKLKRSISQKKWWDNMSKEERDWRITTFQNAPLQGVRKGPSSLEKRIINLNIEKLNFVGDGKLWLTSEGKNMNPDFISNNRKIIEVGDVDFWHNQNDISDRISKYSKINFECLYLTSDQLKLLNDESLKSLILEFLNG